MSHFSDYLANFPEIISGSSPNPIVARSLYLLRSIAFLSLSACESKIVKYRLLLLCFGRITRSNRREITLRTCIDTIPDFIPEKERWGFVDSGHTWNRHLEPILRWVPTEYNTTFYFANGKRRVNCLCFTLQIDNNINNNNNIDMCVLAHTTWLSFRAIFTWYWWNTLSAPYIFKMYTTICMPANVSLFKILQPKLK